MNGFKLSVSLRSGIFWDRPEISTFENYRINVGSWMTPFVKFIFLGLLLDVLEADNEWKKLMNSAYKLYRHISDCRKYHQQLSLQMCSPDDRACIPCRYVCSFLVITHNHRKQNITHYRRTAKDLKVIIRKNNNFKFPQLNISVYFQHSKRAELKTPKTERV